MDWTELLFPKTCPCCGGSLPEGAEVCPACAGAVRYNRSPHCPFCGVSMTDCRCKKNARAYDRVAAPFYYEGSVREAILRMKFGQKEDVARFLADALKRDVEARYFGEEFDLVTAVPMSRSRYVSRGFNQARTLAEFLMEDPPSCLEHAVSDFGLLRKRSANDGSMQHLLGAEGRRQNIRSALSVGKDRDLAGKKVLLVDDIVTTGATVGECAAVLRLSGASRVCVAAAAVTRSGEKISGKTIQEPEKRLEF